LKETTFGRTLKRVNCS